MQFYLLCAIDQIRKFIKMHLLRSVPCFRRSQITTESKRRNKRCFFQSNVDNDHVSRFQQEGKTMIEKTNHEELAKWSQIKLRSETWYQNRRDQLDLNTIQNCETLNRKSLLKRSIYGNDHDQRKVVIQIQVVQFQSSWHTTSIIKFQHSDCHSLKNHLG